MIDDEDDDKVQKYTMAQCTHFKTEGRWFYISGSIREPFLKIFKVEEALRLGAGTGPRGPSIGKVLIWPEPIKMYFASDILFYLRRLGREKEMKKAFSDKRIREIQASLMVQQVHTI